MGSTAIDEQRGGSVDVTIGTASTYRARLPTGPGGVRLYVVRPTVAGVTFRMPDPAYCSVGAEPVMVIINKGTEPLSIVSFTGGSIGTLPADNSWEVWLIAPGVDIWLPIGPFPTTSVGGINGNRKVFDIVYSASSTTVTRVRNDVAKQYGYVGADGPAAVSVTIKSGVVLGGGTPTSASFGTGAWPAGSTVFVTVESGAFIAGAGGAGGRGSGNITVGTAGAAGGLAMDVRVNTALVNNGTIQGGGGGGGGGSNRLVSSVNVSGSSGGGGAGANPGVGGPFPAGGTASAAGSSGSFTAGGAPGSIVGTGGALGGTGGAPGQAGTAGQTGSSNNGTAGGAAGVAITVNITNGFNLTKLVNGTILGAETTF